MYAQCSVSVLMSLMCVYESKCVSVLCASFLSARRSSRKTEFNHREQWHIPCDRQHFWPKPHVEYHSPRWTNWKPLSVLPILPVCEWVRSYVRDLFETCCVAFPVGFLWIRKQWHHRFMNKQRTTEELCESSCKQNVSNRRAAMTQKQSIMYDIHSINRKATLCTWITWLLSPLADVGFNLSAVAHTHTHIHI